jgi:hypothetical protein
VIQASTTNRRSQDRRNRLEGADWREVARIVLHRDSERGEYHARQAFDSHLARAKWMTEQGYRQLLRGRASR